MQETKRKKKWAGKNSTDSGLLHLAVGWDENSGEKVFHDLFDLMKS